MGGTKVKQQEERERDPGGWSNRSEQLLVAVLLALVLVACSQDPTTEGQDADPVVALGTELYSAECQSCHGGITGGEITDIPPPHNAEGHTWHHPDCQLVDITLGGLPERPGVPEGMAMPAFEERLTVEQIQYVLAFIKTMWTQEQREWQAEVTERLCP